jgi:hypothetical protein
MCKPLRNSMKRDDEGGDETATDRFTDGSRAARQRVNAAAPARNEMGKTGA